MLGCIHSYPWLHAVCPPVTGWMSGWVTYWNCSINFCWPSALWNMQCPPFSPHLSGKWLDVILVPSWIRVAVIMNTKSPGAWVCSLHLTEFQVSLRRLMRAAPFFSSPVLCEQPAIAGRLSGSFAMHKLSRGLFSDSVGFRCPWEFPSGITPSKLLRELSSCVAALSYPLLVTPVSSLVCQAGLVIPF